MGSLDGRVAIITGAFEIIHAFWTKGWGGFFWQVLLGILYIALGAVVVSHPVASALILSSQRSCSSSHSG